MKLQRFFQPGLYTSQEFAELERNLETRRKFDSERTRAQKERIAELEDDLGRIALVLRSLAELCIQKGVLTPAELKQRMLAADLDDGVADQRLDPKALIPGESRAARAVEREVPKPQPRKRR